MSKKSDVQIADASREAEHKVASLCQAWGYATSKVPETAEKRSDFRVSQGSEKWVVEVKSRHGDKMRDQAVLDGQRVEYNVSPHAEPAARFHPMAGFRKAAAQIRATRHPDELAAVWFILSDNPSDELNADEVVSALLGSRKLMDFAKRTVTDIYGVYEPEFGADVDVVVFERGRAGYMLLNPWSPRLMQVRSSSFVTHYPVRDPQADLKNTAAVMAPSESEARRLGEQFLAKNTNTDAKIDRFEGRRRREWQVQLALQELGLPPMLDEKYIAVRELVLDDAEL